LRVLSRLTRPAALATVSLCALAVLTACGDDEPEEETAPGFEAVEVSGPVGEEPQIEWKAMLEPGKTQVEVVEEGDGPVLEKGDQVLTNVAISTDFSGDISYDTFGEDGALLLEVGTEKEPTQVIDLMTNLISEQIEAGTTTVGTRIAAAVDAEEEFGDLSLNLSQLGIGNQDGFVVVADLEAVPLDGAEGKSSPPPSWAPEITYEKGEPTNLDSSAQPKPDAKSKKLLEAVLTQGTGPVVEKGDTIVVDYIGQLYDGDKPFDDGFARKEPTTFSIGVGGVVKGWDQGLVGQKVGSRVLLQIPPALGYGKEGQGEDIPPNSTLYFVIDVLAAA
jgi:peptidylprolyl isomerase